MENVTYIMIKKTRDRLVKALDILESIDDPAPSDVDYLEIAGALTDAIAFFELILMDKPNASN